MNKNQNYNLYEKLLTEIGDLGDRMITGYPMTQGGALPGAINIQGFNSPEIAQDPAHFGNLISKNNNVNLNKNNGTITRLTNLTNKAPQNFNKDIDKIKYKVTPDEIICGFQYELQHMVVKDSQIAKQNVVKNLKADPQFYSKLHVLGVYPNSDEIPNSTVELDDASFEDGMTLFEILKASLDKYKKPPTQKEDWTVLGQGKSTDLTKNDPAMKNKTWTIDWSYNSGKTYKKLKTNHAK